MARLSKQIVEQLLNDNPDLKAQGLRPKVIWVRESDGRDIAVDLERQIVAINESPDNEAVLELADRAAVDMFAR